MSALRASRDQVVDLVVEAVASIPSFAGRVWREAPVGWDERTYPAAIVATEGTRIDRLGEQDGYELQRRITRVRVAIGVREFAGEDPVDELSDLTALVEDAVTGLENATSNSAPSVVETVDAIEIGEVLVERDANGRVLSTDLTFAVEIYTMKGRTSEILAG